MTSFIEYLLESRKKICKQLLQERYGSTRVQNMSLATFRTVLSQHFEQDDVVKLCCPIPNVQNRIAITKNEFGWQPGATEARLETRNGDPAAVGELLADIEAIRNAGGDLDAIHLVVSWNVGGHQSHNNVIVAWDDDRNSPGHGVAWIGVECTDDQLEAFVANPNAQPPQQRQEEPQAQAPNANTDAENAEDEEECDEVNGQKFKLIDDAAKRSLSTYAGVALALNNGPVMVGRWEYREFLTQVRRISAQEMVHFKTTDTKTAIRYCKVDWDDSVDSFVKRLGQIAFYKEGNNVNAVMQLAFNGHPSAVRFKAIDAHIVNEVVSQQCRRWFRSMVGLYLNTYKTSRTGIEVLFDRDRFFRKNSKYNIQQDPPFTIGQAVQNVGNAVAPQQRGDAADAGNAAQDAAQVARRQPLQPRGERAANLQLKSQVDQIFKQNRIIGFEAFVGRQNSKDIPKTFQNPFSQRYCMAIEIPGVMYKTMSGNEAIDFLKRVRLWDGKVKPAFELVQQQHEDAELILYTGGKLK